MGPAFGPLIRRLWPMMLAICAGTLLSVAWLTGGESDGSVTALGIALVPILVRRLLIVTHASTMDCSLFLFLNWTMRITYC